MTKPNRYYRMIAPGHADATIGFIARYLLPGMVVWLSLATAVATHAGDKEILQADSVLIRLIDQVDVPARATGILSEIHVVEGAVVEQCSLLGKIDDTEARLIGQRTKIELKIASVTDLLPSEPDPSLSGAKELEFDVSHKMEMITP